MACHARAEWRAAVNQLLRQIQQISMLMRLYDVAQGTRADRAGLALGVFVDGADGGFHLGLVLDDGLQ